MQSVYNQSGKEMFKNPKVLSKNQSLKLKFSRNLW